MRIVGTDPHTGAPGQGIAQQLQLAMRNLQSCVESGGASLDNVAQVSFFVKNREDLVAINGPWVEMFPNDQDRPTYKFMQANLPGDQLVALECFALAGARRRVLQIPNVAHSNPIPLGVRMGTCCFRRASYPTMPQPASPRQTWSARRSACSRTCVGHRAHPIGVRRWCGSRIRCRPETARLCASSISGWLPCAE
ncbi:MAG: RidA family protein [Chloroflexi bacterium]|nr:RidA family protein [Chloroflexota bacterium]